VGRDDRLVASRTISGTRARDTSGGCSDIRCRHRRGRASQARPGGYRCRGETMGAPRSSGSRRQCDGRDHTCSRSARRPPMRRARCRRRRCVARRSGVDERHVDGRDRGSDACRTRTRGAENHCGTRQERSNVSRPTLVRRTRNAVTPRRAHPVPARLGLDGRFPRHGRGARRASPGRRPRPRCAATSSTGLACGRRTRSGPRRSCHPPS
jgi:hypothetical protein